MDSDRVISSMLSFWSKNKVDTHHLVTDGDYQGRGLATKIYRSLINDAANNGVNRIIGWIAETNYPSIKLHERLGFCKTGRTCLQYYLKED